MSHGNFIRSYLIQHHTLKTDIQGQQYLIFTELMVSVKHAKRHKETIKFNIEKCSCLNFVQDSVCKWCFVYLLLSFAYYEKNVLKQVVMLISCVIQRMSENQYSFFFILKIMKQTIILKIYIQYLLRAYWKPGTNPDNNPDNNRQQNPHGAPILSLTISAFYILDISDALQFSELLFTFSIVKHQVYQFGP